MEENSMSKAQLLFNSVREIKIAVNALEKFADVVKGEEHPGEQTKVAEEQPTVVLANILVNAHDELEKLAERIHTAIADLRKSLI